jgi:hypothetical protein
MSYDRSAVERKRQNAELEGETPLIVTTNGAVPKYGECADRLSELVEG